MKLTEALKWNKRVSVAYVFGVWSMIGAYSYFRYTGRYEDKTEKKEEEEAQEQENPNEIVLETAHNKTILIYKEDFVPYTTKIYNFITSISGPGTGDDEK